MTAREVEKLRIACGSDVRDNAILEVFLATGCRVSEVAHMRIEDIDIKEECIRVLGKGDKERIVFLGARAIEFLEQYLGDRKSGPGYYISSGTASRNWKKCPRKYHSQDCSTSGNREKGISAFASSHFCHTCVE